MIKTLALVLGVVALVQGHILKRDEPIVGNFIHGTCPKYTTMQFFDVVQYVGRWFEITKFDTFFETNQKCIKADYSVISKDPATIKVVNSGLYVDSNKPHSLTGNATATDVSGEFILYFPGSPTGYYNVLYTDYSHYTTIYYCDQLVEDLTFQTAWVLSRDITLSEDLEAEAMKVFQDFGIDVSYFNKTIQGGDCTY